MTTRIIKFPYDNTEPEDDLDPMEEPGASLCGQCGLYPIAADEDHDCDERADDERPDSE